MSYPDDPDVSIGGHPLEDPPDGNVGLASPGREMNESAKWSSRSAGELIEPCPCLLDVLVG